MKISFFELMCLWHEGKKPKKVIYKNRVFSLNRILNDYCYNGSHLVRELSLDYYFFGFMDKKVLEITDIGE